MPVAERPGETITRRIGLCPTRKGADAILVNCPKDEVKVANRGESEVFANLVDRLLRSRGDLLLSSFYQLPVPELGSCSNQRYQMSAG
jgi:hypothetical protein